MNPIFRPHEKSILIPATELRKDSSIVIDPKTDIYSRWKDWAVTEKGIVYGEFVYCRGGGILPDGTRMDSVTILRDGYKIICPDGCLKVIIQDGIMNEEGNSPFVSNGGKILVERHILNKTVVSPFTYFITWAFTIAALVIGIAWLACHPRQHEPYSVVILGIISIIGNLRMKRSNQS